jgi:hypothetical protein
VTRFRRASILLPGNERLLIYKTNPLYLVHKIDSRHKTEAMLTSKNTVRPKFAKGPSACSGEQSE